jgi:hypothetical protein
MIRDEDEPLVRRELGSEIGQELAAVAEPGEAVGLRDVCELPVGDAHLGAHILVESPRADRGGGGGHERGMNGRPLPGVGPFLGPVEDRVRIERPQHPVMDEDEEVEMRLDAAMGGVDEQRRRGEQAKRDGDRTQLARKLRRGPERRGIHRQHARSALLSDGDRGMVSGVVVVAFSRTSMPCGWPR